MPRGRYRRGAVATEGSKFSTIQTSDFVSRIVHNILRPSGNIESYREEKYCSGMGPRRLISELSESIIHNSGRFPEGSGPAA